MNIHSIQFFVMKYVILLTLLTKLRQIKHFFLNMLDAAYPTFSDFLDPCKRNPYTYSCVTNKRAEPNKRAGWKMGQD